MNTITPLTGDVAIDGHPAYRIEKFIGRGGTALCYQARQILPDGSLGAYYVLKEFCPMSLESALVRAPGNHRLVLSPRSALHAEFDQLRSAFLQEAARCREVNLAGSGGRSNFPGVLYCERVPGRDDLLRIDTEDGYTLDAFIRGQRSTQLTRDYVLLCLTLLNHLLAALEGVHRSVLHLDVSPKNVYIVTQDAQLTESSVFAVKLFDLASARSRSELQSSGWSRCLLPHTEGFTDPMLQVDPAHADERTDWYSAAGCLYTMLTGSLLPGDSAELFCVTLPDHGALGDRALRERLEALLSRALRLSEPFSEQEVRAHAFRSEVNAIAHQLRGAAPAVRPGPTGAGDPFAPLSSDAEDGACSVLRRFTAQERALYDAQRAIYTHTLTQSRDELDGYSCHSLPHIEEVMDETQNLFRALTPWLCACLPDDSPTGMLQHLLLGAKFHDVGMAGSPDMRRLLDNIDTQYQLARSGALSAARSLRALHAEMVQLAQALDMQTPSYAAAEYRAAHPGSAAQLMQALARYHDEIKTQIRLRHADTSGQFILERREALAACYGDEFDWVEIALLAALHTGSADDSRLVGHTRVSKAYMLDFVRRFGQRGDDAVVEKKWQRILMEATLLRLADGRRSGSRMRMLDLSTPHVRRAPDNRLHLLIERDGVLRQPQLSRSHDILLAERLVDCGSVSLAQDGDGRWQMTHELLLSHADTQDAQQLFLTRFLPTYVEELRSALLRPENVRHILRVRGTDAAGAPLSRDALARWLGGASPTPGCMVVAGE